VHEDRGVDQQLVEPPVDLGLGPQLAGDAPDGAGVADELGAAAHAGLVVGVVGREGVQRVAVVELQVVAFGRVEQAAVEPGVGHRRSDGMQPGATVGAHGREEGEPRPELVDGAPDGGGEPRRGGGEFGPRNHTLIL